jgi:hypothetical protein
MSTTSTANTTRSDAEIVSALLTQLDVRGVHCESRGRVRHHMPFQWFVRTAATRVVVAVP